MGTIVDGIAKDLTQVGNTGGKVLTMAQFGVPAEMPAKFNGLPTSPTPKPSRHKIAVGEFMAFTGLRGPSKLRSITRAPVIAWRKD